MTQGIRQSRKWMLLFAVCMLAGGAGGLIVFILSGERNHQATAVLRMSPVISPTAHEHTAASLAEFHDAYANTQASVIRSARVLGQVLGNPVVQHTRWFQAVSRTDGDPMCRLNADLSVERVPDSELIRVTFTARDARDARTIVDAVVTNFLGTQQAGSKERSAAVAEILNQELFLLQSRQQQIHKKLRTLTEQADPTPYRLPPEVEANRRFANLEDHKDVLARDARLIEWEWAQRPTSTPAGARSNDQLDYHIRRAQHQIELLDADLNEARGIPMEMIGIRRQIESCQEALERLRINLNRIIERRRQLEAESQQPFRIELDSIDVDSGQRL